MLKHLPNLLTLARLLLAVPLGALILAQKFDAALIVAVAAGATDALDGFLARLLQAHSRFGAALDPVADKVLITVAFLCFAQTGLIPWYVALVVILRDLLIVAGALCYHWLIGPFDFAATRLSKANMFVQICFCLLVLMAQVAPMIPAASVTAGIVAVLFIAGASGFDYVMKWSIKAVQQRREGV
jgi:cardiolipin synthase